MKLKTRDWYVLDVVIAFACLTLYKLGQNVAELVPDSRFAGLMTEALLCTLGMLYLWHRYHKAQGRTPTLGLGDPRHHPYGTWFLYRYLSANSLCMGLNSGTLHHMDTSLLSHISLLVQISSFAFTVTLYVFMIDEHRSAFSRHPLQNR